jgi:predicted lipase
MNKKEAVLCAAIAQSTYGGSCSSSDFRLLARFENKGTDTQGIFGEAYGNSLVVAFRGSEETGIADWITDLKFIQQVYPYEESKNKKVKVHHGFISAYKSVREAVLNEAKKTPHPRIICAGHSLGGALATLCALDLQYNLPDKEVSCYTFGSPKVGNPHFTESYNKRVPNTFRFVNRSDAVPDLPPGSYEHVGELLYLGGLTNSGLSNLVDKVMDKVEAHLPHNYLKALQDWLD